MNAAIGFIAQNISYLFVGIMAINIILLIWVALLHKKWGTIFRGGSGDVEGMVRAIRQHQDSMSTDILELVRRMEHVEMYLPKNIRRVGLVRYNPFSDAGGDQSFALALLNDDGDGIVLSSLYGREMNRVYAKPIEKWISKYQLSDEERQSIQNAK